MVCVVLPTGSAQSSMAELRVMHSAPSLGTQLVHAEIKQATIFCPQTPLKCSIPQKSLRSGWQYSPDSWHFKMATSFPAMAESGKSLLKELWQAASKQQEALLNSIFLSKILSEALSGFIWF